VNPVFLLGCYGCIFHGTGNSGQFCQNLGISGEGGGLNTPKPPRYATVHHVITAVRGSGMCLDFLKCNRGTGRTHSTSGVPRNFFGGEGGSTNSVDDRGQRERISGGGSPLVMGSTQFSNE
jgi:hypothetical protein